MGDIVEVGDEVVDQFGIHHSIVHIERPYGLYVTQTRLLYRHEFTPIKWEGDVIGNTGIGVCAKNGSGQ